MVELIQHKGNSECFAGEADELCSFEYLPWSHLSGNFAGSEGLLGLLVQRGDPVKSSFVREALKEGLKQKMDINANPFKYGFIGSTDTHLGTPGLVRENNYPGHGGAAKAGSVYDPNVQEFTDNAEDNPGGLAVVWAKQNTRTDLFEAMQRKETYATSGPRHILRFFGGWDLPECSDPDLVANAYDQGVPMGSTLPAAPSANSKPSFVVRVMKDAAADAADLQYVQIIKGWVDSAGNKHEKIVDVAGNKNNGASVNLTSCALQGSGESVLCASWTDTEFDQSQNAFYYARVIENPSCRWTQFQCIEKQISCPLDEDHEMAACCDGSVPKTIQERSWSSPIWYEQ